MEETNLREQTSTSDETSSKKAIEQAEKEKKVKDQLSDQLSKLDQLVDNSSTNSPNTSVSEEKKRRSSTLKMQLTSTDSTVSPKRKSIQDKENRDELRGVDRFTRYATGEDRAAIHSATKNLLGVKCQLMKSGCTLNCEGAEEDSRPAVRSHLTTLDSIGKCCKKGEEISVFTVIFLFRTGQGNSWLRKGMFE